MTNSHEKNIITANGASEAIFPSPNAPWNRRASFELKKPRGRLLSRSRVSMPVWVKLQDTTAQNDALPMLALHFTVHPNMDRRSVLLFLGHRTPRASLGRVPCIGRYDSGPGSDLRRGRTGRAGNQLCAPPTPSFVPCDSAQTALTLNKVQPRATWFTHGWLS